MRAFSRKRSRQAGRDTGDLIVSAVLVDDDGPRIGKGASSTSSSRALPRALRRETAPFDDRWIAGFQHVVKFLELDEVLQLRATCRPLATSVGDAVETLTLRSPRALLHLMVRSTMGTTVLVVLDMDIISSYLYDPTVVLQ